MKSEIWFISRCGCRWELYLLLLLSYWWASNGLWTQHNNTHHFLDYLIIIFAFLLHQSRWHVQVTWWTETCTQASLPLRLIQTWVCASILDNSAPQFMFSANTGSSLHLYTCIGGGGTQVPVSAVMCSTWLSCKRLEIMESQPVYHNVALIIIITTISHISIPVHNYYYYCCCVSLSLSEPNRSQQMSVHHEQVSAS